MSHRRLKTGCCLAASFFGAIFVALGDTSAANAVKNSTNQPAAASKPLSAALPPEKWRQMEGAVDRGLAWLATQQADNGSFPTLPLAQPAVTSLCTLAFLSRGYQPGTGPYGGHIDRAIDFVLSCQRPDGLFSYQVPGPTHEPYKASHSAIYNHAIAGLMLGEVYGHVTGRRAREVRAAIEKALRFTRELQVRPKENAVDRGAWRYLWTQDDGDSDLSSTSWQLMFLRSAKNAEFNVPEDYVNEAMGFVHRCWDPQKGVFNYKLEPDGTGTGSTRGLMGAGIVSLSMAGEHNTPMARAAGNWLLAHPYRRFGEAVGPYDEFFYSAYYCSQAAAQLGGKYWDGLFPGLVDVLVKAQSLDGSWPPEPNDRDFVFGSEFTTAFAILSLTPPYQLLPVYQR
jgi:hypothetical protein